MLDLTVCFSDTLNYLTLLHLRVHFMLSRSRAMLGYQQRVGRLNQRLRIFLDAFAIPLSVGGTTSAAAGGCELGVEDVGSDDELVC